MTLVELARSCELAMGPDGALERAIDRELHGSIMATEHRYTASLDAAMALVPEGWEVALYWGVAGFSPEAQLETEAMRHSMLEEFEPICGKASTIALALCAAALRARAAIAMARDSAETACPAPVPQDCQARAGTASPKGDQ